MAVCGRLALGGLLALLLLLPPLLQAPRMLTLQARIRRSGLFFTTAPFSRGLIHTDTLFPAAGTQTDPRGDSRHFGGAVSTGAILSAY